MKWKNENLFKQLGIKTVEEVTDQEIEDAYMDKMIELYILIREYKEKVREEDKLDKEDEYKQEIYNKFTQLPSTRSKIVVLDKWIEELGSTSQEKANFQLQIQQYEMAYQTLKTKEKREEYIRETLGKKVIEYELRNLIKKSGRNPQEELKTKYVNQGSNPLNVKKGQELEYETKHQDEEISLSLKKSIIFQNNLSAHKIEEYMLLINGSENMTYGCTIQGDIVFPLLNDLEYRAVLFQAILQSRQQGSTYFGSIGKEGDEYVIKKDMAAELAIKKIEEIETQKMREKSQSEKKESEAR